VRAPWRGASNYSGWSEPAIFSNFGRHVFETFTVEANIIRQRHECLVAFPVTLKRLTLNDLEMPFYAKICFHCWFY